MFIIVWTFDRVAQLSLEAEAALLPRTIDRDWCPPMPDIAMETKLSPAAEEEWAGDKAFAILCAIDRLDTHNLINYIVYVCKEEGF